MEILKAFLFVFLACALVNLPDLRRAMEEDKRMAEEKRKQRAEAEKEAQRQDRLRCDYRRTFENGFTALCRAGKWAMARPDGALITDYEYDEICAYFGSLALVRKDGLYGKIDRFGKLAVPCTEPVPHPGPEPYPEQYGPHAWKNKAYYPDACVWDTLIPFPGDHTAVRKGDKWAMVDPRGRFLTGYEYEGIWAYLDGLALAKQKGLYGKLDESGRLVEPCDQENPLPGRGEPLKEAPSPLVYPSEWYWDQIIRYDDGSFRVMRKNRYALLKPDGRFLTDYRWEAVAYVAPGRYEVKENGLLGILKGDGTMLLPCRYNSMNSVYGGMCYGVKEENRAAILDGEGKVLLENASVVPFRREKECSVIRTPEGMGYLNTETLEISTERWEEAERFQNGFGVVTREGKKGLVDRNFRQIIPCKWTRIAVQGQEIWVYQGNRGAVWNPDGTLDWGLLSFTDGMTTTAQDGKIYLMTDEGIRVGFEGWDNAKLLRGGLAAVRKDGRWGFVNMEGRLVVPCRYTGVQDAFADRTFVVTMEDTRLTIDKEGTPLELRGFRCYHNGLAVEVSDGKLGYVNRNGDWIVPPLYDVAMPFNEGLAAVCREGKWGFVNRQGGEVIPCGYEDARRFQEGFAAVKLGGLWAYLDQQGTRLTGFYWQQAGFFRKGKAHVLCWGLRAAVHRDGTIAWDDWQMRNHGAMAVYRNNKAALLNARGKLCSPFRWYRMSVKNGFVVCRERRERRERYDCTIMDREGRLISQREWEDAAEFSGTHISVRDGGKWGLMDLQGRLTVPCHWEDIHFLAPGFAQVLGGLRQYGVITTDNREIVPCKEQRILGMDSGIITVRRGDQVLHLNNRGEILPRSQWDDLGEYSEGLAPVKKDGLWGFIDPQGALAIPCTWHRFQRPFRGGKACVAVEKRDENRLTVTEIWIDHSGKPIQ